MRRTIDRALQLAAPTWFAGHGDYLLPETTQVRVVSWNEEGLTLEFLDKIPEPIEEMFNKFLPVRIRLEWSDCDHTGCIQHKILQQHGNDTLLRLFPQGLTGM